MPVKQKIWNAAVWTANTLRSLLFALLGAWGGVYLTKYFMGM